MVEELEKSVGGMESGQYAGSRLNQGVVKTFAEREGI